MILVLFDILIISILIINNVCFLYDEILIGLHFVFLSCKILCLASKYNVYVTYVPNALCADCCQIYTILKDFIIQKFVKLSCFMRLFPGKPRPHNISKNWIDLGPRSGPFTIRNVILWVGNNRFDFCGIVHLKIEFIANIRN